MNQEVLKLALEWAEAHGEIVFAGGGIDAVNKMNSWATAIKEALRENAMREVQRLGQEIEQEPVAKVVCNSAGQISMQTLDGNSFDISKYVGSMFYTTPPQQEPVAYWKEHAQGLQRDYDSLLADFQAQLKERNFCPRCGKRTNDIHTCTPPQDNT